jgi:hypothetical protein
MDGQTRRICDFLWYGFCPSMAKAQKRFEELRALVADDTIATFHPASLPSALVKILAEFHFFSGRYDRQTSQN